METMVIAICIAITAFSAGYMLRICEEIRELSKKY